MSRVGYLFTGWNSGSVCGVFVAFTMHRYRLPTLRVIWNGTICAIRSTKVSFDVDTRVFAPSFADPFADRQTKAMNVTCLPCRFVAQACFDANTGRYSTCITLGRVSENANVGGWKAVGLLMTKTHLIVTGNDGSIDWLTLPEEPDDHLKVRFCNSLRSLRSFVLDFLHVLRTTARVLHQGFYGRTERDGKFPVPLNDDGKRRERSHCQRTYGTRRDRTGQDGTE